MVHTAVLAPPASHHPLAGRFLNQRGPYWRVMMTIPRKSVLLVEDDPLLRCGLAESLRAHGLKVVEARDATEALSVIRREGSSLDVLVTDYELGEISGIHVAFEFRFQNPLCPIFFITGHALPGDMGRMSGVQYLRKPFPYEALLDAITAEPALLCAV